MATNQPEAVSNLLVQSTGISFKATNGSSNTNDPVEKELDSILEQDDAGAALRGPRRKIPGKLAPGGIGVGSNRGVEASRLGIVEAVEAPRGDLIGAIGLEPRRRIGHILGKRRIPSRTDCSDRQAFATVTLLATKALPALRQPLRELK